MEENFVYDMTPEPHFFDKVLMVRQGNDSLVYTYGHDLQRISMEEHVGVKEKFFSANYHLFVS